MHIITTNSRFEVFSGIDLVTERQDASLNEALEIAQTMKKPRIVVQSTREEVWPEAIEMLLRKATESPSGYAEINVLNTGEASRISN